MKQLTHKEEEVMSILWRLEKAFVNDILEQMEVPQPPYNTVSSIVRKLVAEGHIGFTAFGKTHQYFPILKQEDYRKGALQRFVDNYFSGSPAALLSYFVKEENLDPQTLDQLLKDIQQRDEEQQSTK